GGRGEQSNALLPEPAAGRFRLGGLALEAAAPWSGLRNRRDLLERIESRTHPPMAPIVENFVRQSTQAYSLLENRVYSVLNLDEESSTTRERYGPSAVGQSLLMAPPLVAARLPPPTLHRDHQTQID